MNNTLKASIGIDFSLIGTMLHAMYEKNDTGYAVLLIPSEQSPDSGISVMDLIEDIKKMSKGVSGSDTAVDTKQLEDAMTSAAKEGSGGDSGKSMKLDEIIIKLQMAYLYICKKGDSDSILEYAFQLQVVTDGLVPEAIKPIVDVTNLSISVWNTDRKKVVDKMALVTVDEYLGTAAALPDKAADAAASKPEGI